MLLDQVAQAAIVTRGELLVFLLGVEVARRQLSPALEKELQEATDKIACSLKECSPLALR